LKSGQRVMGSLNVDGRPKPKRSVAVSAGLGLARGGPVAELVSIRHMPIIQETGATNLRAPSDTFAKRERVSDGG
jgi:hypothetical protein